MCQTEDMSRKEASIIGPKRMNDWRQTTTKHILFAKAFECTKKNHHKFRHIAVNTSQYRQSFFPKTVGPEAAIIR